MSWNIGNIGATASSRGPAAVPEEDEGNLIDSYLISEDSIIIV